MKGKKYMQGCRQGREEKGRIYKIIVRQVVERIIHQKTMCIYRENFKV